MEQMGTFMAEYAEWFYMGSSIVILILLIYVLHRIKKQSEKPYDEQRNRKKIAANRKTKQTKRNRR